MSCDLLGSEAVNKFKCISNLPGLLVAKNSHSIFLNMTQDFAKVFGWKSADKCIGLTDYEIPCRASELAESFRSLDKKVHCTRQFYQQSDQLRAR